MSPFSERTPAPSGPESLDRAIPPAGSGAIRLKPRRARVLTPANAAHRTVMMALERGQLAELLVDGQASHGHRVVAAILGAVLKLPPLQRALASKQVKSRYLDRLMAGR